MDRLHSDRQEWWLLECSHYGIRDKRQQESRKGIVVSCEVCPPFMHYKAQRRAVKRVER